MRATCGAVPNVTATMMMTPATITGFMPTSFARYWPNSEAGPKRDRMTR